MYAMYEERWMRKRGSCGAAIRLPGVVEGADWSGRIRRETYDLAEGSSRCSVPVRAFWSSPVKAGQAWSSLVKAKTGV
jgi:hypothetical protein